MKRPNGFTLVELVISTALLSLILGGAYLCLRAGMASQQLVESRDEALQNARVALSMLSADLRAACPLSKDYDFIGMQRTIGKHRADNLDFATHHYSPRRAHEMDWCEVSYFLDKDARAGTFTLWRRRDPTPDVEPFAGGTREEIARNLVGLQFAYYDGFEWFDEWGDPQGHAKEQNSFKTQFNLSGLPEAVRITLWIEPGSRGSGGAKTESESASGEPPLVFQTVARLNLAGVTQSSGLSSSSSSTNSSGSNPAGETGPPNPGGPTL